MPVPRIDDLTPVHQRHGAGSRLWAEWCFLRVCFRHMRVRLLIMALILFTGALMFRLLEPKKDHSLVEATYYTFSLIFAEQPEEFPVSRVLQVMFFLVPILGLTVIIEGIVDFALVLRDRRRFEKSWCVMLASSFTDHIVLVGLGRLGYPTFQILRRLGEAVVVIERDATNEFLEEARRDGSPLLLGDARQQAILEDANIEQAKSIIVATDNDMTNLETALDARKLNPSIRVVVRMFDQNVADKIRDGFNIHLAMSQSAISAPTFATCALSPTTVNSVIVGAELVAMQRWLVRREGPLCGKTVGDVTHEFGVLVVEHRRQAAEPRICPVPETTLEAGDGLLLQGPIESLNHLRTRATERRSDEATKGGAMGTQR